MTLNSIDGAVVRLEQHAAKKGERHVIGYPHELHFHRHSNAQFCGCAVKHTTQHAHAFGHFDHHRRIRHGVGKRRMQWPHHLGPGIDRALPLGTDPPRLHGTAMGADLARHMAQAAALAAALKPQLAALAPGIEFLAQALEGGQRLLAGCRQWVHHAVPFGRLLSYQRRRIAMLPSPKSPQPVTTPISASSTWRAPASPRNCRTASTTCEMSSTCACDSSPPWVLTGRRPPSSMPPFSTKAPPSPRPQNPASSIC